MKNIKFAEVIDFIFINSLVFLISFVWINFFKNNILLSVLIALFFLCIFNIFLIFFGNKRKNKNKISKKLEADIEQYMFAFLSNTEKENLEFFNLAINAENSKIHFHQNIITYFFNNAFIALSPIFKKKELIFENCLKVLSFVKKLNIKKVIFLCYNCDSKTKILLKSFKDFDIQILDKKSIYLEILKKTNIYPKIKFEFKESKKLKFKQIIDISFNKSRAKGYFLSGILIFFCSFIVRYNFYYVFMSSLLFLFTIFCFIKKQEQVKNDFF